MPDHRRNQRRAAEKRGRRAEQIAEIWLILKGYRILARRIRLPTGEIDLIARRAHVLAFIEVKQRRTLPRAQHAVSARAWHRIAATGEAWALRRPRLKDLEWRYDLVAIVDWQRPYHFRDYWRP